MVVLDEDGKPCKVCDTLESFQSSMAPSKSKTIFGSDQEPPTGKELGNGTWTMLHSTAANFPLKPTDENKQDMRNLLTSISHLFPCRPCGKDFEAYLKRNSPNVEGREELSLWLCDAHNAVNKKLGKQQFDCKYWKARWREGWAEYLKDQK
ncbi:flavin-linked sulfhydryl oxidase [Starmerella bacillaris]|mgnify:CR=1 FL=1|uniref:Sulfhydryl oxidase n=1 Tax=Starmerella bacillaris TaxID=1247836 RepID=A0AAV5RGT1_STABA|nr:flavin-linked sulfhydryl oxidase [Starmerella bacillaris]